MNKRLLASVMAVGLLATVTGISTVAATSNGSDYWSDSDHTKKELESKNVGLKKKVDSLEQKLEKQKEETSKYKKKYKESNEEYSGTRPS